MKMRYSNLSCGLLELEHLVSESQDGDSWHFFDLCFSPVEKGKGTCHKSRCMTERMKNRQFSIGNDGGTRRREW